MMAHITLPKLTEYQRFAGDDDMWSRGDWQRLNSADEWYLIRQLLQDITIVRHGLASPEYAEKLQDALKQYCDSETTIQEMKRMAQV